VLLAVGTLVVALVAELGISRAGSPSDFSLFVGHFHPLVVHLPIGVLMLVGVAEVLTFFPRYRTRIDPALGLALPALLVVTVSAFVLGLLLARGGGFAMRALVTHHRLELFAVLSACLTTALWGYHSHEETTQSRTAYRAALFLTLALLSAGAHFGGTVTHGDSYLTEFAPGPFKALLGGGKEPALASSGSAKAPKAPSSEPLVYADVVAPILRKYCVDCHGPKKSKGKFRLDSLEGILKGGEDGPAVVAGSSSTSELVKRLRLPVDDDDRMPPEGKPGPNPGEVAVLAFWIDRGANATLRVRDTLAPESGRKLLEASLGKSPVVPGRATEAGSAPAGSASAAEEPREAASAPPKEVAQKPAVEEESKPEAAPTTEEKAKPAPSATTAEAPAEPPSNARAILAERCQKCHGPTKKKGGLRVDSVDALFAGGENGPAVVAGDPEGSELVRRIRLPASVKEHMPPKKETQLSNAEVAALTAWVRGLAHGKGAPASVARTKTPSTGDSEPKPDESAAEGSSNETKTAAAAPEEPKTAESPAPASEGARKSPEEPPESAASDAELLARLPARLALYEDAVAPLLSKRCGKCHHGPKPAARLRIDDYEALLEGGLSGPGIVPGKPEDSLVVHRVSLPASDDDHMPPADEPSMTADEVALVTDWVKRGAGRKLEVASKELDLPVRRAAAGYANPARPSSLRAGAGCAACTIGSAPGAGGAALGAAGLLLAAFSLRRVARLSARAPSVKRGGPC
jgi:mono/diheme cytochrome c family protein/uncharacterized membrane protein